MGLRERLRRLEREAERTNVPTFAEYSRATARRTARSLASAYRKLAAHGGNPPAGRRQGPEGDTPEQAEADRRTVEAWKWAYGAPDIRAAADEARARLPMRREEPRENPLGWGSRAREGDPVTRPGPLVPRTDSS